MGAKNKVIAGDYTGRPLSRIGGTVVIILDWKNSVKLDKDNVGSYEVITEDIRKSAVSGVARGAVGAALLGPVGLLAGLSAKNKGIITVAVRFKDGKNSLIEMDLKMYKALLQSMF